jgi:RNA polymerase sigma-B factor
MATPAVAGGWAGPREHRQSETNRFLREAHEATTDVERRRLLDEVVLLNVDVAHAIASRFRNRGIPDEDLEQIACLALVRAAHRFDPSKADDFLSYAAPTIRGEIKRHFRDHGWAVRPPRRIQETQSAIIASGLDFELGADELATRLGLPLTDVREALDARGCFTPQSLDVPVRSGGDTSYEDLLSEERDGYGAAEARVVLQTLTGDLQPRERLILYLRFVEDRTQQEIGEEIGVTQMQVSRLLSGILLRMRKRLAVTRAGRAA